MLSDQYNIRAVGRRVLSDAQRLVMVTTFLSQAVAAVDYENGTPHASETVLRTLPPELVNKAQSLHPHEPATKILHVVPAFYAINGLNPNGTLPDLDSDAVPRHVFTPDDTDDLNTVESQIAGAQAFQKLFDPFNRVSAEIISNHLRLAEIARPAEIAHAVYEARNGILGAAPESMQSEPVRLEKLSTWMPYVMNQLRERAGAPQIFNTLSVH